MLDAILGHWVLWIVEIVVGIGLIIFIHEFGHFIMAKRNGVRVEIFSLGFGPPIIRRRRGETEYRISWVPLGGYVKMAGEQHSEKEDPQPYELASKSAWARFQIFVAGAVMNLLIAFPIFILAAFIGKWEYDTIVGTPGAAESAVGMQPGDRIVSVDGAEVLSIADYKMMMVGHEQGALAAVVVERDGRRETLTVKADSSGFHDVRPPSTTVLTVLPGTPVAAAGLRGTDNREGIRGDILTAVNGTRVYSAYHYEELLEANIGKPTTLTFRTFRDGEERDLNVEVVPAWKEAGTKHFPLDYRLMRPVIGSVEDGTPAAKILEPDDVVLAIEGAPIRSWHDLREGIKERGGVPTRITVEREGIRHELAFTPAFNPSGQGQLGVAPLYTPEIADASADSIYKDLKPGDRIKMVNGVEGAFTVNSIFAASTPKDVAQGPAFMRGFSTIQIFLLAVAVFGLITLGPVSWLWLNKVEPNKRREFLRFTLTLGAAAIATLVWTTLFPTLPGQVTDLTLTVSRDGQDVEVVVAPEPQRHVDFDAIGIGTAGWDYQRVYRERSFNDAVAYGVREPINIMSLTAGLLKKLVMGRESTSGLAGPVGIFQFSYKSAEQGPGNLLWILGLITVNLGVFNLLPIPLLDGGHVALLPYEVIFKRRPSIRFEVIYQWTGLILLLSLVVFVTWNDIQRILS